MQLSGRELIHELVIIFVLCMRRYIKSYLLSEQFISAAMAERSMPRLGLTSNNSTLWVNLKRALRADSQMSLAAERCCRWITGSLPIRRLSGSDSRPRARGAIQHVPPGTARKGRGCLDTVISPFLVLLISSQDAAINIERVPEELAAGIRELGVCERCAFIIKVSWDALKHLRC